MGGKVKGTYSSTPDPKVIGHVYRGEREEGEREKEKDEERRVQPPRPPSFSCVWVKGIGGGRRAVGKLEHDDLHYYPFTPSSPLSYPEFPLLSINAHTRNFSLQGDHAVGTMKV